MQEFIETLINKSHLNMSKFQIDNFIINEQITDYKKAKQILLELRLRYEQLIDFDDDIRLKELEIKKQKNILGDLDDEIESEMVEIKISKLYRQLNTLRNSKAQTQHEVDIFEEYFSNLIEKVGKEELENMITNQEQYEPDYWANKFIRNATFEMISYGRLSEGVLASISTLDPLLQHQIYSGTMEQFLELREYLDATQKQQLQQIETKLINGG